MVKCKYVMVFGFLLGIVFLYQFLLTTSYTEMDERLSLLAKTPGHNDRERRKGTHNSQEIKLLTYQYLKKISEIRFSKLLNEIRSSIDELIISEDTENSLYQNNFPVRIPSNLRVTYADKKWENLNLPVLGSVPEGRLGNVMGEYATIFALQKIYNTSVVVIPRMKTELNLCFPSQTIPYYEIEDNWRNLKKGSSFYNYVPYELAASGLLGPNKILLHGYPFEMQLFNLYKTDLRREFIFYDSVIENVATYFKDIRNLQELTSKPNTLFTFVGIHLRRTDYNHHIRHFGGHLPTERYYEKAINYYRSIYASPVFIVASDDMKFARHLFENEADLHFTSGESECEDLAILIACNHSVISVGSFGFWSGYLAGGEVVYPDMKTIKDYRFSRKFYEQADLEMFTPIED